MEITKKALVKCVFSVVIRVWPYGARSFYKYCILSILISHVAKHEKPYRFKIFVLIFSWFTEKFTEFQIFIFLIILIFNVTIKSANYLPFYPFSLSLSLSLYFSLSKNSKNLYNTHRKLPLSTPTLTTCENHARRVPLAARTRNIPLTFKYIYHL